jgi:hypothetical protein
MRSDFSRENFVGDCCSILGATLPSPSRKIGWIMDLRNFSSQIPSGEAFNAALWRCSTQAAHPKLLHVKPFFGTHECVP